MTISDLTDALQAIAQKASPLSERLGWVKSDSTQLSLSPSETEVIKQRQAFWCQIVSKGDPVKFQRRLEWGGISDEILQKLLSISPSHEVKDLPDWLPTLEAIILASQDQEAQKTQLPPLGKKKIPFQELYVPALIVAKCHLNAQINDKKCLIAEDALYSLEIKLLESLAQICAPVLMQEFSEFRQTGNLIKDYLVITLQGHASRDSYDTFITHHLEDGLLFLFQKYSVLGRLMAIAVNHWVTSTSEMIRRLQSDWSQIEDQFAQGETLQRVIGIEAGLSDPHQGGRTVAILTFDTELKLVYKPKSLGLEKAFQTLIYWYNEHQPSLPLICPLILNRTSYGWSSFIEHSPCENEAGIRRFYQRQGLLMGLIYCLMGTDCHYENWIAAGEYPVLIDMETLLSPTLQNATDNRQSTSGSLNSLLENSVLQIGILPNRALTLYNHSELIDMSGLGKFEELELKVPVWKHTNTDGMQIVSESTSILQSFMHQPVLNEQAIASANYISELTTGFKQMYRWLIAHQNDLFSRQSPIFLFQSQQGRYIFRNTRIYASILLNSFQPPFMQSGLAHSLSLELLSKAYIVSPKKPNSWPIFQVERESLENLDIPCLSVNTSEKTLELGNGLSLPDLFADSSFHQMLQRFKSLNEEGLSIQTQIIRLSLYSRFLQEPNIIPQPREKSPQIDQNSSLELLTTNPQVPLEIRCVEVAKTIAKSIQQQFTITSDGNVTWLGIGYSHSNQSFSIQTVGLNLFDGCCGVSLFYAALYKLLKEPEWRELSLLTLQPVNQLFTTLPPYIVERWARDFGIGGGTGLGSVVYALTQISQMIEAPELLIYAQQAADLITPHKIKQDRYFDVIEGSAGSILGLLALYHYLEGTTKCKVLDAAIACGQHLLDHQQSVDETSGAWKTWQGKQLTGFSQGAAGIAYALLCLFQVTKDVKYQQAAIKAIAYEQSQFSSEEQNWFDLRSSKQPLQVSWAHGAPGIGLARMAGLTGLDNDEIQQQIAIALMTTQQHLEWGIDSIAWGTLGRLETLLISSEIPGLAQSKDLVHQTTISLLNKAQNRGEFKLFLDYSSTQISYPGFFHGLSGIGYQLLRIVHPSKLPSILTWEI